MNTYKYPVNKISINYSFFFLRLRPITIFIFFLFRFDDPESYLDAGNDKIIDKLRRHTVRFLCVRIIIIYSRHRSRCPRQIARSTAPWTGRVCAKKSIGRQTRWIIVVIIFIFFFSGVFSSFFCLFFFFVVSGLADPRAVPSCGHAVFAPSTETRSRPSTDRHPRGPMLVAEKHLILSDCVNGKSAARQGLGGERRAR